jgi:hypothetical protein
VSSFNGATGAVTGVSSVNGSTGAVTNIATTTGNLSQFAATTSAQLRGVISDETGSGGGLVFATSPTISLPSIDNTLDGYTTTATAGGTTALTSSSTRTQVFTGSSNQVVTLPDTSTIPLGTTYRIINLSTGTVTVRSFGAANLGGTLANNLVGEYTSISTSVNTGTAWAAMNIGTNGRTGTGNLVLSSAPSISGGSWSGGSFSGNPVIDSSTYGYTAVATAGTTTALSATSNNRYFFTGTTTQTVTLPTTSVTSGMWWDITNLSTGTVTVNASGGGLVASLTTGQRILVTANAATPTTAAGWNLVWVGTTTGAVASTAGKLSQFAATTSSELAGVISDETGSGSLVFGTSPTIATPTITGTEISGHRNVIINGNFSVDQRNSGGSQTFTAGAALAYSTDRWYGYCTGANVTGQQIAGSAPARYYYRFTGATSNTAVGLGQRIEAANSFHMAGKTVTLSANIASSSLTSVTWTVYYANTTDSFGTLASPTRTQVATGTFSGISSSISLKQASFTMSASATTGIEVVFSTGALLSTQTLTFSEVQLEVGSAATPFERRSYTSELALCQRYYYRWSSDQTGAFAGSGVVRSSSTSTYLVPFPVTMRATPTTFESGTTASNWSVYASTSIAGTSLPANASSNNSPSNAVVTLASSGLTAGQGAMLLSTATNNYLGFSAEL